MADFLPPNQESLHQFLEILDFQVALPTDERRAFVLLSVQDRCAHHSCKLSHQDALDPRTTPGLLLLKIDAEEVGFRRTARIDEIVRRNARRYVVLINQLRAGNAREIRFTGEALRKAGRRGSGLDGYHRCL